MSTRSARQIAFVAVAGIAVVAAVFVWRTFTALPAPGSEAYEQVTRAFYRGLASLEVGLLDDAKREFTTVTTEVAREPAAWANLGLAHLRLGELDEAAAPIDRAVSLAPENADLELLAGRMEIARGRLDEGLAHLRRAAELAPDAVRPRFALAEEVERAGAADADTQALGLLDDLVALVPGNTAVLVERARIAAKARDVQRLSDSVTRLEPIAANWPAQAMEQYSALQRAVASADPNASQRATAFLRNVLARVPAFREDLAHIRTPTELIAEAIPQFIVLATSSATPAPVDTTVRFDQEPLGPPQSITVLPPQSGTSLLLRLPNAEDPMQGMYVVKGPYEVVPLGGGPPVGQLPMIPDGSPQTPNPLLSVDWDNDFTDDIVLAGSAGARILLQGPDGRFTPGPSYEGACNNVAAADIEMDGDIDLVCSGNEPVVLRNNGDGTLLPVTPFRGVGLFARLAWGDVDGDADPDAVFLDGDRLRLFVNRQAGDFAESRLSLPSGIIAMTLADFDADGMLDVVTLAADGGVQRTWLRAGEVQTAALASWPGMDVRFPETMRLVTADLDNNGALDLIATGGGFTAGVRSRYWLSDERHTLHELAGPDRVEIFDAVDLTDDGRLDLIAVADTRPGLPRSDQTTDRFQVVRLINRGTAGYHWKRFRFRAQPTAGDQRVNSFGLGGFIEVRSGLLFHKQRLTGGPVHVGLGMHSTVDVARIVWPNGVPQAEFGIGVDDTVVVEQRLKGSCPWVFTWDGRRMVFVTDFLWRSPLGLRINAQDTAGVTQTEDWVRLRGDQLAPRDGFYDVRITAELWETHFFDHVSLMAVDHPDGTEVYVDERFSPTSPPAYRLHALRDMRPVRRAVDHRGTDVTATIASRDGAYLATFARGRYQGIAEDHYVEIEPGTLAADSVLVATGWIYPTDSSINVAIAQAGITPRGLSLEALQRDGTWRVVNGDLGFPAGKNKSLVIDLKGAAGAERVRLSTNLEIYWDSLQLGSRTTTPLRTTRVAAATADLRYRGFSHTSSPRGDAPETPDYDRVASTSPRWRDLTGYHTRFGDVRELIQRVDDRYVIMNAGDEMRLQFPEVPLPESGWRRDFVLIGDGWEKDGDYNTGFSQTVLPLPSHDRPDYGADTTSLELEDDPVYQRHRDDWQRYHTRYVTPERFLRGLKPQ